MEGQSGTTDKQRHTQGQRWHLRKAFGSPIEPGNARHTSRHMSTPSWNLSNTSTPSASTGSKCSRSSPPARWALRKDASPACIVSKAAQRERGGGGRELLCGMACYRCSKCSSCSHRPYFIIYHTALTNKKESHNFVFRRFSKINTATRLVHG